MKGSSVVLGSWEVAICYEDKNISVVNNTMLSAWLALFSLRQVSTDCGSVHSVLYTGVWSLYWAVLGCTQLLKFHPRRERGAFFPSPTRLQPQARPGFTTLLTLTVHLTVVLSTLSVLLTAIIIPDLWQRLEVHNSSVSLN